MLLIFLDTETTGLNPKKHRIIEIAFRIFDTAGMQWITSYESIVFQPAEIWAEADPKSLAINGYTWEMALAGKPEHVIAGEISEILAQVRLREKEGAFICQNPSFDRIFFTQLISAELQQDYGWPYHWMDLASMYWAFRMFEDKSFARVCYEADLSKDKIAIYLGLQPEETPHRATNGVTHLIECYKKLFQIK